MEALASTCEASRASIQMSAFGTTLFGVMIAVQNLPTQWEFFLRASLALGLGAAIGLERQLSHHEAGLKTNALVSLGTALFVAIGMHFQPPDRVIAQVVTGVGFLGAGMIMRDGLHVRGLNTAATSWCSAAIGMLAGIGDKLVATDAAVLVIVGNVLLREAAQRIETWQRKRGGVEEHDKGQ